ncbi:MAG: hypothetical protein HDS78_08640 [Bacteroidales bacterium]|nr:hypothetical protein [Bacteroidales bacterium]
MKKKPIYYGFIIGIVLGIAMIIFIPFEDEGSSDDSSEYEVAAVGEEVAVEEAPAEEAPVFVQEVISETIEPFQDEPSEGDLSWPDEFDYNFTGTLGSNQIRLGYMYDLAEIDGVSALGGYSFDDNGNQIKLFGIVYNDGRVILNEFVEPNAFNDSDKYTGKFYLRKNSDGTLDGTFTNLKTLREYLVHLAPVEK